MRRACLAIRPLDTSSLAILWHCDISEVMIWEDVRRSRSCADRNALREALLTSDRGRERAI